MGTDYYIRGIVGISLQKLVEYNDKIVTKTVYNRETGAAEIAERKIMVFKLPLIGKEYEEWEWDYCEMLEKDLKELGLDSLGGPWGAMGIMPQNKPFLSKTGRIHQYSYSLDAITEAFIKAKQVLKQFNLPEQEIRFYNHLYIEG